MTVRDFISKIEDNYVRLVINEYDGNKLVRRVFVESHMLICTDIPEDILAREIQSIIPYYDWISIRVAVIKEV